MPIRLQPSFFDVHERSAKLTEMGDALVGLNEQIDWEAFRPSLNGVHDKARKSNAGAKPIDVVLMFKILVLQQLHNLSDDRIEYQIRDRLSFMRFLGLQMESRVPDAKTVWLFRERLKKLNLVEALFAKFHEQLASRGYIARAGQMIDAESNQKLGYYAACLVSAGPPNPGCHRRKAASRSWLSTLALTCKSRCAPRGVHRICCFLTKRLASNGCI